MSASGCDALSQRPGCTSLSTLDGPAPRSIPDSRNIFTSPHVSELGDPRGFLLLERTTSLLIPEGSTLHSSASSAPRGHRSTPHPSTDPHSASPPRPLPGSSRTGLPSQRECHTLWTLLRVVPSLPEVVRGAQAATSALRTDSTSSLRKGCRGPPRPLDTRKVPSED